jgi:hypothetical protein
MISIFFRDRHNNVFPINDTKQDGCVEPTQMIGRADHISGGNFFKPMDFNRRDEPHEKANNGA